MRSDEELRVESGYPRESGHFEELIAILDNEVRLITPTDVAGVEAEKQDSKAQRQRYYQLTHDYLVPSVRDWLTRKDRETRPGRAKLRLTELGAVWEPKQENRFLPGWWEWLNIRFLTRKQSWSSAERRMMRQARKYHGLRLAGAIVSLGLVAIAGWQFLERMKAEAFLDRLRSAAVTEVPALMEHMGRYRSRIEPALRQAYASEENPKKKLVFSLALLPSDCEPIPYVYERLLQAEPQEFTVIRNALAPSKDELTPRLWAEFADKARDSSRRFRAACALAEYAGQNPRWTECASLVIEGLLAENPLLLNHWREALEPARSQLLPALAASLEEPRWTPSDLRAITQFYRSFCTGQADPFGALEQRLLPLEPRLAGQEARGKANVAAALVALEHGDRAWPLLVHTAFPTLRSYLIERLGSAGVDPKILSDRFQVEPDTSARRALILALGDFPPDHLFEIKALLIGLYKNDPDPGIHGAAGWVLRNWKQSEEVRNVDNKLATGKVEGRRDWYLSRQKQTFAIIRQPPSGNAGPGKAGHSFAIAATEVTVAQFRCFKAEHKVDETVALTPDSPVNKVTWYDAAEFCNWLSKQEGIRKDEWCYSANKEGLLDLAPDYIKRSGYRLPTEAEWEFACRAGAETTCSFGQSDDELTGMYAWWLRNCSANGKEQCSPVGLLKPNDCGLFDMHGNVAEWCQESSARKEDVGGDTPATARGGHFNSRSRDLDWSKRVNFGRKNFMKIIGFRVARTMP
jgi:hypothetical protein